MITEDFHNSLALASITAVIALDFQWMLL